MPRDPWRELEDLLRRPTDDVAADLELLLPRLGIEAAWFEDGGLRRLRELVQERKAGRRSTAIDRRARSAAEALRQTAVHRGGAVHLDPRLVLGDLAVHPSEFVSFEHDDAEVIVRRRLLRDAGRVLRPFPDVRCFLDTKALHLRWREGRGGLDLAYTHGLNREERRGLFRVSLEPVEAAVVHPAPAPEEALAAVAEAPQNASPPVARPSARTWPVLLGDVLSELGLIP